MPLTVEIWSDVVCPWCYLGKRRFEAALERFEHRDEVTVLWRSFELDPEAARDVPGTAVERLAGKFSMTLERAQQLHHEMEERAAADGLEYHMDQTKGGNSFDAHRMIHLAATYGHQTDAQERFFRAYFTEGESLGVWDTLVRLMQEIGVDGEEAREALRLDRFAEDVREDEALAQQLGIQGVPFFVFERRYGLSGAQPVETMLTALERAWEEAVNLQA
ncbi:DsbA family oxidoreductase [Solirubrobacter sp. CPCC 204708]|uniref:DsbA family oxidoreductase n=1 Tax=Solirubrobacter deserti TaxID=2282478 RepID=A0ABT4RD68_9ACTN|nr:DsbA family oxidoreductase [Solirubrobacter deserti]MBE2317911.1 DsbA family oxidoreductase [Solirubrobacter deserti]MDA0136311.1 DsbA family oxidoreductase [Solirubrobacter deserti]